MGIKHLKKIRHHTLDLKHSNSFIQTTYCGDQYIAYFDGKNINADIIEGTVTSHPFTVAHNSNMMNFKEMKSKIKKIFIYQRLRTIWLTESDEIYATGENPKGQLGINDTNGDDVISKPQIIEQLCGKNLTDVQFGNTYTIALCSADTSSAKSVIERWFRLENVTTVSVDIINLIVTYCKCNDVYSTTFCRMGGNGHSINDQTLNYKKVQFKKIKEFENVNIVKISAGDMHSMFLDSTGIVWVSGYDHAGYCGIGDRFVIYKPIQLTYFVTNKICIIDIKCGPMHTLAIDENGKVYGWGTNGQYQCGITSDGRKITKPKMIEYFDKHIIAGIDCGNQHSYCRTVDDKHYLFGDNDFKQCLKDQETTVKIPFCINNFIHQKVKEMTIKFVCLGYDDTKVIITPV